MKEREWEKESMKERLDEKTDSRIQQAATRRADARQRCLGLLNAGVQEVQLLLRKANRTAYVRSPTSEFQSRRWSDLSKVTQFYARYVNGTLSRKLQWTLVSQTSHVVILPSDINSYRANEQKISVLQLFLTIKRLAREDTIQPIQFLLQY